VAEVVEPILVLLQVLPVVQVVQVVVVPADKVQPPMDQELVPQVLVILVEAVEAEPDIPKL